MKHDPGRILAVVLALALCGAARPAAADSKSPLDAEARFQAALQHLEAGRVSMAIEEIQGAIKDDSKNPYFYKGLGVAYMRHGDHGKAIEALQKALDLNPYYTDVRNDLGTALMLAGRREEGKREFLTAFNDPTYNLPEHAARNIAFAYFEEKNYEESLTWYRTAVQRNPKYPDGWLGIADIYLALGRPEEAARELEVAQRHVPDSLQIKLGFGEACYRAGRLGEAREALEKVAREDPVGALGRRAAELLKAFPR